MSSILEALRELEGERARSGQKTTSVVDAPREPQRSLGAVIPLTGGLAIGVVAFGERTSRWNRLGLGLAVLAIALIAFAPD